MSRYGSRHNWYVSDLPGNPPRLREDFAYEQSFGLDAEAVTGSGATALPPSQGSLPLRHGKMHGPGACLMKIMASRKVVTREADPLSLRDLVLSTDFTEQNDRRQRELKLSEPPEPEPLKPEDWGRPPARSFELMKFAAKARNIHSYGGY